jgi:hypothetical protein
MLVLLTACATPQPDPERWKVRLAELGFVVAEPVQRIRNFRVNGWVDLDRSHVILEAGVNERYLVTLRTPCDGVRNAVALGFSTTAGSVTRFDQLRVRGPGNSLETCWIESIHRLERASADGEQAVRDGGVLLELRRAPLSRPDPTQA